MGVFCVRQQCSSLPIGIGAIGIDDQSFESIRRPRNPSTASAIVLYLPLVIHILLIASGLVLQETRSDGSASIASLTWTSPRISSMKEGKGRKALASAGDHE